MLFRSLIRDEGLELKPYTDTKGKLSIGIGINLDAGITRDEALWLCQHRVDGIRAAFAKLLAAR